MKPQGAGGTVNGKIPKEEIEPATEEEIDQLRENYDNIMVKSKQAGGDKQMHIISDDSVLCGADVSILTEKTFKQVPRGYWGFCDHCVESWRRRQ